MPPPPSFIDVTAVPFSQLVTQAEFNAGTYGGTANETWLRYVASERLAIGVHSDKGGNYVPRIGIYESDGSTLLKQQDNSAGAYQIVDAGTYYIRVRDTGGTSINFDFTISVNTAEVGVIPPQNGYIINDDAEGFPASVFNS